MKNSLRLFLCLGVLSLAGVAEASNAKTYMPSFCRVKAGAATFGSNGEIVNASTVDELNLECPIVRDEAQDPVLSITVILRDRNLDEDIRCRVRTRSPSGSTSAISPFYSTSGSDASGSFDELIMLIEMFVAGIPFNPADEASMLLECILPPASSTGSSDRSALFSYLVVES